MAEHTLKERLVALMDQKTHWALPSPSGEGLSKEQQLIHFRHEYAVYVRDLPELLAATLRIVPASLLVRPAISMTHANEPELFLKRMETFGFDREQFTDDDLHPAAESYKLWLREMSVAPRWQAALALLTIFVEEGHRKDAWQMVLDNASSESEARAVMRVSMEALARWQRYRDGVAERMGLTAARAA